MMKFFLILVFISLAVINSIAQDNIILEIEDDKITVEEFKRIYFKNNKDSAHSLESLEEYLKLFTNFKLKVYEAQKLGLHKQKKFINELGTYRSQLVKPYLTDSATDEQMIRDAYERMKYIVRAQHILFKINPNAKPADTLAIYKKASEVLAEINNGADFTQMAKQHSEDPSVKFNDGDLGYFSAFKMVYEFENAAFNLNIGQVSNLVRTQFGYHIIKVNDKREAPGTVEAAHIMVRLPENAPEDQATIAKRKIDEVYQKLLAGENFEEVAKNLSEDPQTASKGGRLPDFTPGRMLPSFEQQIFQLKKGSFSEPFRTRVGWHVVKNINNQPVKSLDEERAEIKLNLSKTARADLSQRKVIQNLKTEYNLICDDDFLVKLPTLINHDSLMAGKWSLTKDVDQGKEVCSFANQKIVAGDVLSFIQKRVKQPKTNVGQFIDEAVQSLLERQILDYEKAHLEDKYPDFAWLIKEYHDGILLFNITDSIVWQKAVADTAGLRAFYQTNKNNYMWAERMKSDIIEVKPYHNLKTTQKIIKKTINKEGLNGLKSALIAKFGDSTISVTFNSGLWERGGNRNVDLTQWKKDLHLADKTESYAVFVFNHEVVPAEPKRLNEVRGLVTADYQNFLEQKWIETLREKYRVVVHSEMLKELIKN